MISVKLKNNIVLAEIIFGIWDETFSRRVFIARNSLREYLWIFNFPKFRREVDFSTWTHSNYKRLNIVNYIFIGCQFNFMFYSFLKKFCIFEFFRVGPGFSAQPAKNPARTRNSGSGSVSGLNFKSGPGSGFKIKFFSGSEKPGFWNPGSKISGQGRTARCRALEAYR